VHNVALTNSVGVFMCLQEKMAAMLAEEEEQKRLDLMMEIERLRALEAYQVRPGQLPGSWLVIGCSRLLLM
jgi:hypothetical protein